jgi:hypothetical protein
LGAGGESRGSLEGVGSAWAAVVFWHSLEHLPDASAALARAVALLLPSGMLAIAVPNNRSFQAKVFGDRWFAVDTPRHLVHLDDRALTERLRELGLRIGRTSHVRGGQVVFGWLDGLVGSLPGGLSLYDAIRRAEARSRDISNGRRLTALLSGTLVAPVAVVASAVEIVARRGGSFYVEAHRPAADNPNGPRSESE